MLNFAQSLYDSIPAVLGGALTGICVIAAAIITSKSITRLDKASHKKKLLNALEAEILGYIKKSRNFNPRDSLHGLYQVAHNKSEHKVVFSSELNNLVYKSLAKNLHVLPENVVAPIVEFYNTMYFIELILDAIKSPEFKKMTTLRKMEVYYDYVNLKVTALDLADKALKEIWKAKS